MNPAPLPHVHCAPPTQPPPQRPYSLVGERRKQETLRIQCGKGCDSREPRGASNPTSWGSGNLAENCTTNKTSFYSLLYLSLPLSLPPFLPSSFSISLPSFFPPSLSLSSFFFLLPFFLFSLCLLILCFIQLLDKSSRKNYYGAPTPLGLDWATGGEAIRCGPAYMKVMVCWGDRHNRNGHTMYTCTHKKTPQTIKGY